QEVRIHENETTHAEVVGGPFQVAGAQLNAIQRSRQVGRVLAAKRIDVTFIAYRAHPDAPVIETVCAAFVIELCRGPAGVGPIDSSRRCSTAITRRAINLI